MARDVFISYRHEDQEWASRICNALEAQNLSCWVAFRDIPPGANWPAEIMDALKKSRFFVVVLSSHSVNEEQISREVRIASDELKLPIFPLRVENVQPPKKISYFLGDIQWLDVFEGKFDPAMQQLARRIKQEGVPAERTEVRPSTLSAPAVNVPRTSKRAAKPAVWIGIAAAALIVVALIIYFANRPRTPETAPQAAIDTAYRFVNALNAGNLTAAWNELTPERQKQIGEERWMTIHRKHRQEAGSFSYKLNSCPAAQNQQYTCDFTLTYSNGKVQSSKVGLVQEKNGNWGVSSSTVGVQE